MLELIDLSKMPEMNFKDHRAQIRELLDSLSRKEQVEEEKFDPDDYYYSEVD